MRRTPLLAAAAAVAVSALFITAGAATAKTAPNAGHTFKNKRVCSADPGPLKAACDAHIRVKDDGATPAATITYSGGYSPSQLRAAYNAPTPASPAPIVAVVDAYASPTALADLTTYRTKFGLGAAKLFQFNQTGEAITTVAGNVGWGQEEALDLDMVSAMCPQCTIYYVGANSASYADLTQAVKTAHALGAKVISNSYGSREFSTESAYASAYSYTDAVVTVSSGDSGYGAEFPAAIGNVVAVGGTSLTLNASGARVSETVWSGGGSGCSAYLAKPAWQHDKLCPRRTIVDVAAVADPYTGVAVYDSYGSTGGANWYVFGGTSVAAPLVGAYYAAAGIPTVSGSQPYPVATTYANATSAPLFDVNSGSNGRCGRATSSTYYLCHARSGYDGPTGLGTPKGAGAF